MTSTSTAPTSVQASINDRDVDTIALWGTETEQVHGAWVGSDTGVHIERHMVDAEDPIDDPVQDGFVVCASGDFREYADDVAGAYRLAAEAMDFLIECADEGITLCTGNRAAAAAAEVDEADDEWNLPRVELAQAQAALDAAAWEAEYWKAAKVEALHLATRSGDNPSPLAA